MTPGERAAKITDGWKGVVVGCIPAVAWAYSGNAYVGGDAVLAVNMAIADAIREANAELEAERDALRERVRVLELFMERAKP